VVLVAWKPPCPLERNVCAINVSCAETDPLAVRTSCNTRTYCLPSPLKSPTSILTGKLDSASDAVTGVPKVPRGQGYYPPEMRSEKADGKTGQKGNLGNIDQARHLLRAEGPSGELPIAEEGVSAILQLLFV